MALEINFAWPRKPKVALVKRAWPEIMESKYLEPISLVPTEPKARLISSSLQKGITFHKYTKTFAFSESLISYIGHLKRLQVIQLL